MPNQFVPGMSVQNMYDAINSGALNNFSDSSKTAFMNYFNAENANQHELEMWRLNNEYNTPENQIKRLIAAGLNPAVAYDQVNAGNSGSAPGTHKTDSTAFHDTSDKLARINTLINGISSIMSGIGSAVSSASGVQDIALKHQNNWFGRLRSQLSSGLLGIGDGSLTTISDKPIGNFTYELYPGAYVDQRLPMLFPELVKGFSTKAYDYNLKDFLNERQQGYYNKQMEVNNILQSLFSQLDNPGNSNISGIFKNILKLISIQIMRRY